MEPASPSSSSPGGPGGGSGSDLGPAASLFGRTFSKLQASASRAYNLVPVMENGNGADLEAGAGGENDTSAPAEQGNGANGAHGAMPASASQLFSWAKDGMQRAAEKAERPLGRGDTSVG